jgi:predicted SprT family Zn-dependent metalloprotease
MKTLEEIIQHIDHVISIVPGSAILSDEEWQTLKSAVLAQQTNNKQSTPCEHDMVTVSEYRCNKCGWVSSTCYE